MLYTHLHSRHAKKANSLGLGRFPETLLFWGWTGFVLLLTPWTKYQTSVAPVVQPVPVSTSEPKLVEGPGVWLNAGLSVGLEGIGLDDGPTPWTAGVWATGVGVGTMSRLLARLRPLVVPLPRFRLLPVCVIGSDRSSVLTVLDVASPRATRKAGESESELLRL